MKKALISENSKLFHYEDDERREGPNEDMTGDCTYLRGDCTYLSGDCTSLIGDCSGLKGNLDECELTEEDRKNGVNIKNLIK